MADLSGYQHDINFRKFDHSVTLNVRLKLTREFYIRKWIAQHLIILAALVLGCGIEIEDE